jgi:hypothetical protein
MSDGPLMNPTGRKEKGAAYVPRTDPEGMARPAGLIKTA